MVARRVAPVYRDAYALCEWLLGHWATDQRVLQQTTCEASLHLLDRLALVVRGVDRERNLESADTLLVSLRNRVRLAADLGDLTVDQALHALEGMDAIGRQIGGWLRSLDPV